MHSFNDHSTCLTLKHGWDRCFTLLMLCNSILQAVQNLRVLVKAMELVPEDQKTATKIGWGKHWISQVDSQSLPTRDGPFFGLPKVSAHCMTCSCFAAAHCDLGVRGSRKDASFDRWDFLCWRCCVNGRCVPCTSGESCCHAFTVHRTFDVASCGTKYSQFE